MPSSRFTASQRAEDIESIEVISKDWDVSLSQMVYTLHIIRTNPGTTYSDVIKRLCTRYPEQIRQISKIDFRTIQKIQGLGEYPLLNQRDCWTQGSEWGKVGFVLGMNERGFTPSVIAEQVVAKYPSHRWAEGPSKVNCVEFAIELFGVCERRFSQYYRCTEPIPDQILQTWAKGVKDGNAGPLKQLTSTYGYGDVIYILTKWDPDFWRLYIPGQDLDLHYARARTNDLERHVRPEQFYASVQKQEKRVRFVDE